MLRFLSAFLALAALPVAAQTWEPAAPLSTPRSAAAAAVLDGRLYVVGGRTSGGQVLRSAEVFTPGVGWAPIASREHGRAGAQLLVFDGRLYLVGGQDEEGPEDDMDVYDPASDSWDSDDSMDDERDGLAAGVIGGRLYALGGANDSGALLAGAEAFDVAGDRWGPVSEWTLSPARAVAGSASDGTGVVVAGGFSALGPLASVVRFVPGASGAPLADFPTARGAVALAASGATLFAIGGRDAADVRLAQALRLDAGASGWTPLAALPEARENAVAVVIGPDLYVVGGADAFGSAMSSVVRLAGAAVAGDAEPQSAALQLVLDGPMPTSGTVRLRVSGAEAQTARVAVYDLIGREVAVLHDGPMAAEQRLSWNAPAHPAGLYLVRLTTSAASRMLRVTTVRR